MANVLYSDYEYLTPGEQETSKLLGELPQDWTVICNKILPRQNLRTSREIDFIVIGDNTVVAIDEKSWRGEIHGTDLIWQRTNGDSQRSPLNKIDMVSKVLASHVASRTPMFNNPNSYPFTYGAISLSVQETQPRINDPRSDLVFLAKNLLGGLQDLDERRGIPEIGRRRNDITKLLFDLSPRPKRPHSVNEYTIVDGYDSIGEAMSCRAVHTEGMERLLTIFASAPNNPEDTDFYLQEFRTMQELAALDVSPRVYDYFRWSDDYLVVPSEIPQGRSYGSFPAPGALSEFIDELKRARAIFEALAIIHERGIIHRALSFDNIYISEPGDRPVAMVTGFYAARRPNLAGLTISPRLNRLNVVNLFAAPEIQLGYEWAHHTSDTYSASLILLERLSWTSVETLRDDGQLESSSIDVEIPVLGEHEYANIMLNEFFASTLGNDPPTERDQDLKASQRLSAQECVDKLAELIGYLEAS